MSQVGSNILAVDNLSVSFKNDEGYFDALKSISFNIPKGKIVALVGESGSGKSVTSMAIMGLLPKKNVLIKNGSIPFYANDTPVNLLKQTEKQLQHIRGKQIAMVFQEPMSALNPLQKVGKQVTEMILAHNNIPKSEALQQCIQLFTKVLLPNPETIVHKYPHELSGGQKQRVVIAMALSCNPALIICDEPTTALDVTVQHEILQLLKQLQQEQQLSVLFISHDLQVVAQLAHEIVVLYKGEIVEKGLAKEVLQQPKHNYTKALLQCRPGQQAPKTLLPTVKHIMNNEPLDNDNFTIVPPGEEVLLEVKNILVEYNKATSLFSKTSNRFLAVNNVSFTIKRGEVVGLVGESGCGKTTIGRTIIGLQQLTSGNIIWHGKQQTHKSLHWQMVFQDPFSSLNPRINIGNAISEGIFTNKLQNKKDALQMALQWLEKTGLQPGYAGRYPHEFSGGQRQRIVISRALALQPEFIICDESVSALDVSVQAQVLNILLTLKNELGFSILFISHDMNVIQHICDRVLVMRKGEIVEEGAATDVFKQPKHAYTQRLIESIPGYF
jgi:peptide/nickel transport system ATP-binding protein